MIWRAFAAGESSSSTDAGKVERTSAAEQSPGGRKGDREATSVMKPTNSPAAALLAA